MMNAIRRKIKQLVCGDDGAALVVTLALFMMMYVACAGVFAVGRSVKEKMILQNAADAAAYSAAVVQADTLSRIATINRAMAWTYKSLVCHQMDYVTRVWLEKSCDRWEADKGKSAGGDSIGYPAPLGLDVYLGKESPLESIVRGKIDSLSFLEGKISSERQTLAAMNDAVHELIEGLDEKIKQEAGKVLLSNLPGALGRNCLWRYNMKSYSEWTRYEESEKNFLQFAKLSNNEFAGVAWFPLDDSVGYGFMRSYKKSEDGRKAEWVYKVIGGLVIDDEYKANETNQKEYGGYDKGQVARPLVLKDDYFEDVDGIARGAISIAVAKKNANPWERLVDLSVKGIYDMFKPSGAANWTWAVASAQAAYRPFEIADTDRWPKGAYSLSSNDCKDENLRTDDWDAVFVPVCRSFNADDFSGFMTKADGWERVNPTSGIDPASYDASSLAALPSMHNSNGSMKDLAWGEILKKMYH